MLTQVRSKSQITIPGAIVNRLGLREGDQLEVTEKGGIIQMIPVSVYPKGYVDQLEAEIAQIRESGFFPVAKTEKSTQDVSNRIGAARDLYRGSITLEDFDRDNEAIADLLMKGDL